MAQEGKISFLGLCNWDEDLFENMVWPDPFESQDDADPVLDKQSFLYELITRTAELEVMYPDPEVMKGIIGFWSKTRVDIWNHLWATTQYEYNPIENYDRIEDGTDKDTHTGTDTNGNTLTHTGTDTVTDETDANHYEAAYNSAASGTDDGLVKTTRDDADNTSTTVYGSTDSNSGSFTHGHVLTRDHDLHVHGNIGTVTAQKMILEERNIATFNLYDVMIRDFMDRFCILVY